MLAGIFASLLIVTVTFPKGYLASILSIAPLRFFGKYSYGLYVIHALVLPGLLALLPTAVWMEAFGNWVMLGSLSLVFTKIAICTVLAFISYRAFELPFLKLKRFFQTGSERYTDRNLNRSGATATGAVENP